MKPSRVSYKKVLYEEQGTIGNITSQFIKTNLRSQRSVGISPDIAAGNAALGYHRGLAWGRAETVRDIVRMLRKKYPEASQYIKTTMEYDYKYK